MTLSTDQPRQVAKALYVLIGPKGAGKTYIGALISRHTAVQFIAVESIWLSLPPGADGWQVVEQTIDAAFEAHSQVMIESLGAGDGFRRFHASLAQKYPVQMIRVVADLETCLERIKTRDRTHHIPVTEEQVMAYNRIAAQVSYPWALEIDNSGPASDRAILAAIQSIL
jgi:shikimate kinase